MVQRMAIYPSGSMTAVLSRSFSATTATCFSASRATPAFASGRSPTRSASEHAAAKIVADLVADGYMSRTKEDRRRRYEVNLKARLRHPLFEGVEIGPLIEALRDRA
jgi:MoxR-like ATPase